MSGPVDVLVAIPAHDEADSIAACLRSVIAALAAAREDGVIQRARIAVAAHRCVDDTAARSRVVLRGSPVEWLVREEPAVQPVGWVRSTLIQRAVRQPVLLPARCWVFSTDADTVVPLDWVTGLLAVQRESDADLILGLADLDSWSAGEAAHHRYRALLEAGIGEGEHRHAYEVNLAVRWATFAAVGGFPTLPHGEEHALAGKVRAVGGRVVSPVSPVVQTSARMPGRAAGGLGDLLDRLARGSES